MAGFTDELDAHPVTNAKINMGAWILRRSSIPITSANTKSGRASSGPVGREIIVRRDDLPFAVPANPGVRESIPAVEGPAGPLSTNDKPSRDDRGGAERTDPHALVMSRRRAVRSPHPLAQERVATDRVVVFRVDEPLREEPPKERAVALHQSRGPVIFQTQQLVNVR